LLLFACDPGGGGSCKHVAQAGERTVIGIGIPPLKARRLIKAAADRRDQAAAEERRAHTAQMPLRSPSVAELSSIHEEEAEGGDDESKFLS
jgi:hypothetical protein